MLTTLHPAATGRRLLLCRLGVITLRYRQSSLVLPTGFTCEARRWIARYVKSNCGRGHLVCPPYKLRSSAPGLEEFIQRSSATGGMPDRAGATKDEVYRAIEALTLGERLKLKHFAALGGAGTRTSELWAHFGGSFSPDFVHPFLMIPLATSCSWPASRYKQLAIS